MQPGLGLAKNKPNWKETNKKSQQKGGWKVIQLVLIKGIEWLDQLSTKRKGNLQVSLALKKVQKRTWQLIQYFLLLRPNYQLEHWITSREKNEYKICYASGQIHLGSSLFSFYQEMIRTMKMSFCITKI